jgi:CRISPR/Cas system-associated endonuclease/helicase Cas3
MFDSRNNNGSGIGNSTFDLSALTKRTNPFLNATKEDLIKSMDRLKGMTDSINIIVSERKKIRDIAELNYQEEYERLEKTLKAGTAVQADKDFFVMFKTSLDAAEADFCLAMDQKFKFEALLKQLDEALNQKMSSPGQEGMRN